MDYQCLKLIDCKQGVVRAVRFNVDGSYCLTCGSDRKLKLWNPHRGLALKTYAGHGNEVLDACGSCDNSQIISAGADKTVILWDVTTGTPLRRLRGHASKVNCVRFNEDSSMVCSGGQDNAVHLWDIKSRRNEPVQTLNEAKDNVTCVQVTNHEILSASIDSSLRRYDIRNGQMFTDFLGEPLTFASITRDDQGILVSCADNTVKLIDKDSGELLNEYKGHKTDDFCVESCMDVKDTWVLSGSTDGHIWCWDLVSGKVMDKLKHIKGQLVHSLSCHPTQPFLLSASGFAIHLWGAEALPEPEEEPPDE